MTTETFLSFYPLPQSDPKTRKVFEQVEKMHLFLNTFNLNQRATILCTFDPARLEEVARLTGATVKAPDSIQPYRKIYVTHPNGLIILRSPEVRVTETFEEI